MCAWFCIDSSSIFFRCLFVSLSIFLRYSVRILPVCSQLFTGSSISPLCASGLVHPQVVPLIISPHLLNVPFIVSWLNMIIYNRTFTVIDNTNAISKLHLEKLLSIFCRFSADSSSIFFPCLLGLLSIFWSYYIRIIARVYRKLQKPALRLRTRPPTSGPTYCIVPFIVSWLNIIIYNRACTVKDNTIFISKLDLEKLLFVFCRYSVDVCSVLYWFFIYFLPIFACVLIDTLFVLCPCCVCFIARVHRKQHKPALRLRIHPPASGPTYCIVPLIERPTYCILKE